MHSIYDTKLGFSRKMTKNLECKKGTRGKFSAIIEIFGDFLRRNSKLLRNFATYYVRTRTYTYIHIGVGGISAAHRLTNLTSQWLTETQYSRA